jgi:hypothetical protein
MQQPMIKIRTEADLQTTFNTNDLSKAYIVLPICQHLSTVRGYVCRGNPSSLRSAGGEVEPAKCSRHIPRPRKPLGSNSEACNGLISWLWMWMCVLSAEETALCPWNQGHWKPVMSAESVETSIEVLGYSRINYASYLFLSVTPPSKPYRNWGTRQFSVLLQAVRSRVRDPMKWMHYFFQFI